VVENKSFIRREFGPVKKINNNNYLTSLLMKFKSHSEVAGTFENLSISILDTEKLLAFSVGDGEIFISKGMIRLLKSEGEFVFVISHEFGHVALGHHLNKTKGSRAEIEADRFALSTISKLGYPPSSALSALISTYGITEFLTNSDLYSNIHGDELIHPSLNTRLDSLREVFSTLDDVNNHTNDPTKRQFYSFKMSL